MLKHIYNVLLICSDYDRFLIDEDGRVEETLFYEYTQLGLSNPPKIIHAATPADALTLLNEREFNLVITMLDLGSEHVVQLAQEIKRRFPAMPIIALSPSPAHRRIQFLKKHNPDAIDYLFYWQGNPNIFLAMIKLVEDSMNVVHDTSVADIQVIILVEDSVRFYSSYLPIMYTSLIQQNRASITEALNHWGRTLRMRGRPKILLARDYEEAIELYNRYEESVLGVISDIAFPKDGKETEDAGLHLCKYMRSRNADVPILLQSTREEFRDEAYRNGAAFIWKQSSQMLTDLHQYLLENYGFGPFIFRDPKTNAEIGRAESMRELQKTILGIPTDSFVAHCKRNDFSRWLRARSMYVLAAKIKPLVVSDYKDPHDLQVKISQIIRDYRATRNRGVIAQFNRNNFDELSFFSRIGAGSLGGKGRGLAFIDMELRSSGIAEKYPDVYLSIPRTIVIATDMFTRFMEENELQDIAFSNMPDDVLLRIFLSKKLPDDLVEDLKTIIEIIRQPITVRSSSMLEDSHFQPFAGVYETCMIPNNGDDKKRLEELCNAIKCVYASTYYGKSKEYLKATQHILEEERMGVVIQQVIGSPHGQYWYPNVSGVARSLNFYPLGNEKPSDGVGLLSFGFGKAVVDAGSAFRFSPRHPKKPVQYLHGFSSGSQTTFYALDISKPFLPLERTPENLELLPLSVAEAYPQSLKYVASTYDQESARLSESISAQGKKTITFNGILKYDAFPLAAIVRDVLELGSKAMSTPIEIEFALNLNRAAPKKPEFSLLQIRPIIEGTEDEVVVISKEAKQQALIYSTRVMGNGKIETLKDIIFVKADGFNPARTNEMATELAYLNGIAKAENFEYVLIVAGRLGSSDPWLGIPVAWSHITEAQVIVETGLPSFQVEPSQGTHFFQNITALGTIYMTVNPSYGDGVCDFDRLNSLPIVSETTWFRHVRVEHPLDIRVNGKLGEGLIWAH